MGNHQSQREIQEEALNTKIVLVENPPILTTEQKTILRKTWAKMQSKIEAVGVVTFLNLFETHPRTLKPFLHHINSVKEIELDEW